VIPVCGWYIPGFILMIAGCFVTFYPVSPAGVHCDRAASQKQPGDICRHFQPQQTGHENTIEKIFKAMTERSDRPMAR
jgi:hypothetical protein